VIVRTLNMTFTDPGFYPPARDIDEITLEADKFRFFSCLGYKSSIVNVVGI